MKRKNLRLRFRLSFTSYSKKFVYLSVRERDLVIALMTFSRLSYYYVQVLSSNIRSVSLMDKVGGIHSLYVFQ